MLATQTLWQSKAQEHARQRRWRAGAGRACQGRHPGHHRQDRRRAVAPATSSSMPARPFASLSIEGRLTVCNMSIEAGARAGMVAPDDTTYQYLHGQALCAEGCRLGQGAGRLAHAAVAMRMPDSIARPISTRHEIAPMVTWGHRVPKRPRRSRARVPDPGRGARCRRVATAMQRGARLYGPQRQARPLVGDRRQPGLHRLLHQ